jgi:NAD(P)-dependent dehydrogenase (short-subunit alcohol dehydrogenase family)
VKTRFERAAITGAGSGIGRAFALELAKRGAVIAVADVDLGRADETVRLVRDRGGQARAFECDVRSQDAMNELAASCEREIGPIDLAILNAGVLGSGEVIDTDARAFERIVAVNLFGVANGCRAFVPRMVDRRRGAILNVASVAGLVPVPYMGPYAASKAGVVALSEALAAEVRHRGVTVTVLCPSFTKTPLVANGVATDGAIRDFAQRILDRFGSDPDDIARLGLDAAARGELYAVATVHGRLAWRAKRWLPRSFARAMREVRRVRPRPEPLRTEAAPRTSRSDEPSARGE